MSEYRRILVVVRIIQSCRKAIQYGVSLARKYRAQLYVIHSVHNPIGLYHYHYTSDRWYYSRSRNGPWAELPRDRYPKEVRFKGGKHNRGRDDDHRDRDRDHDDRRY